jgi:cell division protein FtsW (lipid II flippase)
LGILGATTFAIPYSRLLPFRRGVIFSSQEERMTAEQKKYARLTLIYAALWLVSLGAMIFKFPENYWNHSETLLISAINMLALIASWVGGITLPIIACRAAQKWIGVSKGSTQRS